MKKYLIKRILCVVAAAVIVQSMTAVTVSAAETLPSYAKAISFSAGEQGNGGWYYMYKDTSTGEYVNMTWDGSKFNGGGGSNVNTHFIMPGYGTPLVIGFEVPYTGTVTLKVTDNVIYRSSANSKGGDVAATLKLNNDELWTHTFDNTCYNTTGKTSVYVKENVSVKKGDMIYHEVDCGTNTTAADIYWKPIVQYTAVSDPDYNRVTEFKMVDDIKASDQQGYNGWHYMYKTSTGYADMTTRTSDDGGKWKEGDNWVNFFQAQPAWNRATAIGWQAPYSGTVTLTRTGNFMRLNPGNGDVTATVFLNEDVLKQNDGTDAQWVFGKDESFAVGPNRSYTITDVKVNAGDWIYHVLDCGTNNGSSNIQWQPMITYTETVARINGAGTAENPYIIASVSDYKVFADIVNSENSSACAKLTSDIVWNSNTPQLVNFSGTIGGNNHKITLRGKSLIESASNGAVIRNLTLDGAVKAENNAASFIGNISGVGQGVIIKNCANIAKVTASGNNAAGFVGYVDADGALTIKNSFNYGAVVSAGNAADAFANSETGENITCEGCYYLAEGIKNNSSTVIDSRFGYQAAAEKFASGEIAYKLNNRAGDIAFGQRIGEDMYPTGATDGAEVVYKLGTLYTNTDGMFAVTGTESAAFCASKDAFAAVADHENGVLVSVKAAEVKANSIYRVDLPEKAEDTERKMFVWNSSGEMVPICDAVIYEPILDIPEGTALMTVSFDGREAAYPAMIVDEYPIMDIREIAKITGGTAHGNKLTIGEVNLEYTPDERLAKYGDGHLMLESAPKLLDGRLYIPVSSLMSTTGWTVEYKQFEDKLIIETGTNYPEPQTTVYVRDYETVITDNNDDKDGVIKAFKAAAASAESGIPTKLEFEAGKTYHISEKQDSFALFDLDNLSNLTIEGNGCTFIFERPTNSLVNIEGCTNIKVNNITVEYKERIAIYGTITSKNVDENTINIVIPDDSPLPADEAWTQLYCTNQTEGSWIFGYPMNAAKDIPGFAPFDALRITSIENVSGREYKLVVSESFKNYDSSIKIGDRFAFKSRWNSYDFGESNKYGRPDLLVVTRSKDITFDGIKTNGALLMLAPVSYCDGRITFKNCEMKPTNGDLITSAADGIHASTNRFGIIVENCNLRNAFDDLINTEAYCGNVETKLDEYTVETSRDMYCRVSDEIRFFDTENHAVIGRAFLKAIEKTDDGKYRLTLDRTVDGVVSAEEASVPTVMYNMNVANSGNIIKNNTLANSRRHAYIIRSANSIIENNRMENNSGAATEAANEIYGTSNEGLFPSALTFRNNVVQSEGISSRYTPLKAYSWYARTGEQKAIDGLLIENNTIDVPSINGSISINSVNDLYMLGNTIKSSGEFANDVIPVKISNSKIAKIDGIDFDYKQNVSSVISISGSEVDESNITNINIMGGNTAKPYSIK